MERTAERKIFDGAGKADRERANDGTHDSVPFGDEVTTHEQGASLAGQDDILWMLTAMNSSSSAIATRPNGASAWFLYTVMIPLYAMAG